MPDDIFEFRVAIDDAQLDDLQRRLKQARWPERETVDDWSQGIPLAYVQEVCHYWATEYDWRAREARLNAWPQFKTQLDGLGIHFIHAPSPQADAKPLLLTHGWPGSVVEFLNVLGPLTDPQAHGGEGEQAFHVVAPSLPGFGFSDKPAAPGWGVVRTADAWHALMQRLGYSEYFAQGGDWGAAVTAAIGARHAGACLGIHTNMPFVPLGPTEGEEPNEQERDALAAFEQYQQWESGYMKQQMTRPQTIGYGLVDSPVALAAWILEKFHAWTDCSGHPENAVSRDELLDNVMLYWLTGAGASSARLYWESAPGLLQAIGGNDQLPGFYVDLPSGISRFPKEILRPSRRWAERRFRNLVYWNETERGGHFAAFEQPRLFVQELRACFGGMG